MDTQKFEQYAKKHPKPDVKFTYGTAGFRTKAKILDSVMFSTAILASLRSKFLDSKYIGLMITASHNPPEDNGIKLIDPMGEMLEQSWEKYATLLANSSGFDELYANVESIVKELGIDVGKPANVLIARDSRESGPALAQSVIDGLWGTNSEYHDFGLLTTPQLHFLVRNYNLGVDKLEKNYFEQLDTAFSALYELINNDHELSISIDAANGIGGPKAERLFKEFLGSKFASYMIINNESDKPQKLNSSCGADFVKVNQKLPHGITVSDKSVANKVLCSYDGDADRVVFYYVTSGQEFRLLDGDKISSILAKYFIQLVQDTGLDLKVGVVQTAYANGSSTNYLNSLQIPVQCTPTGVKHLHHVALNYDIGIYFEANGHGTVLFSEKLIQLVRASDSIAAKKLYLFSKLINQTVGDAISDMLAILIILKDLQYTPEDWNALYCDLPNKLAKVLVKDRFLFKTTNAERTLVEPKGLQDKIDAEVAKYKFGRSFVRASGTEDAVRVYAEAQDPQEVLALSEAVSELVKKFA